LYNTRHKYHERYLPEAGNTIGPFVFSFACLIVERISQFDTVGVPRAIQPVTTVTALAKAIKVALGTLNAPDQGRDIKKIFLDRFAIFME
jgi:hypothetical protein